MNRHTTFPTRAGQTPNSRYATTIARPPKAWHPLTSDEVRRIVLDMIG
jgi:hypothetical protein